VSTYAVLLDDLESEQLPPSKPTPERKSFWELTILDISYLMLGSIIIIKGVLIQVIPEVVGLILRRKGKGSSSLFTSGSYLAFGMLVYAFIRIWDSIWAKQTGQKHLQEVFF
jgi:hypothetical protein